MVPYPQHILEIFQWLIRTSFQATILLVMILGIRLLIRKKLRFQMLYWLWVILLLRLLWPLNVQTTFSVFNLIPQRAEPGQYLAIQAAEEPAVSPSLSGDTLTSSSHVPDIPATMTPSDAATDVEPATSPTRTVPLAVASEPAPFDWRSALCTVWLAGMAVFGGYVLFCNFRLWRIVTSQRLVTRQDILDLLEDCKLQLGLQTVIGVVETDKVKTPCLFGYLRPRLLLPSGALDELTTEQLRYVFIHELAHLKRHDILVGWLMAVVQVLHWFNPAVWFAMAQINADRELACDELALSTLTEDEPKAYGSTILTFLERFARQQKLPAMAGIAENQSLLRRRMTMIATFKHQKVSLLPLLGIIILVAATTFTSARNLREIDEHVLVKTDRGKVAVIQTPLPENDYTMVVRFDDNGHGGSGWYDVTLTVATEQDTRDIRIKAYIDGISDLVFKGNTVFWHNRDWAVPGRHGKNNFPTTINGIEWYPNWPNERNNPLEPRGEQKSDIFTLPFELPQTEVAIALEITMQAGQPSLSMNAELLTPEKLVGTWQGTATDKPEDGTSARNLQLLFITKDKQLAGDATGDFVKDNYCELRNIRIDGQTLSFELDSRIENLQMKLSFNLKDGKLQGEGIPINFAEDRCDIVLTKIQKPTISAASPDEKADRLLQSATGPQWVSVEGEQGPSGYALKFDGASNYVRVPNNPSLEPKEEMTIEMWAYIDGPQSYCTRLLRKAGNMSPGYYLAADQGDKRMQVRFDGIIKNVSVRAVDKLLHTERMGSWHHFAGVYAKNYVALYMDGQELDKQPHEPKELRHSSADLYIGHGMVGNEYFEGMIDEVRIWNVARTEDQIKDHMKTSVSPDTAGLISYWKFDEGAGNIAHDSARNQNHGQLESRMSSQFRSPGIKPEPTDKKAMRMPAQSIANPENLPGTLIFHGRYHHRSRGRDIDTPSELWIKQDNEGNLNALSCLTWSGTYDLATGQTSGQLTNYRSQGSASNNQTYLVNLEFQKGQALLTRRGVREDCDNKTLAVPEDSFFNPNSRPDSYCADNIFLRGLNLAPGRQKEFRVYDWDNTGEALVDYAVQIENTGKETITVPAGTFEANHYILKQVTSADTWFKKRAGHITDYWVLDNHIIVRIVRHREPYELELLDYTCPENLGIKR